MDIVIGKRSPVTASLSGVEVVLAANELDWHDFKKMADKLAKKKKLDWESVEVRRFGKNAKKKTIKVGPKKFVIEPGDLFMFLEDDDDTYLWLEGMKDVAEVSQRTFDSIYDASRNLKQPPAPKVPRKTAPEKILPQQDPPAKPKGKGAAPTQTVKDEPPVNMDEKPSKANEAITKSMFPSQSRDNGTPLSRQEYEDDDQVGHLYTMHGGANVYLLGAGARVMNGMKHPAPYAVYIDKTGGILRSREPVDLKKPAMNLRVLKLEGRLSYDAYVRAYRKAAEHIRNTLADWESRSK